MAPVPWSKGRVTDLPRNVNVSTFAGMSVTLALHDSTSSKLVSLQLLCHH